MLREKRWQQLLHSEVSLDATFGLGILILQNSRRSDCCGKIDMA